MKNEKRKAGKQKLGTAAFAAGAFDPLPE